MIAMQPEGDQERCLTKKIIPFIIGSALVAGFAMFIAGVVVWIKEIAHAAISSVQIHHGPILLLVAGILSLVVACIGFFFIKRELTLQKNCTIIVFLIFLFLSAVLALVAGGYGISHRNKLEHKFEEDLKTKIKMYGRTGYELEANIDRLQKKDECCGVFTYADWRVTVYGGHRYDRVPDSCCKEYKYGCGFKFSDEAALNKRGCASIAIDKMEDNLTLIGAIGLVFGIAEIILFFGFLGCYLKHVCQDDGNIANVKVEYRKTDTPSGHDDDGGEATGAERGGSSGAQSHDAPPAGKEDTGGSKATVHPMKS